MNVGTWKEGRQFFPKNGRAFVTCRGTRTQSRCYRDRAVPLPDLNERWYNTLYMYIFESPMSQRK